MNEQEQTGAAGIAGQTRQAPRESIIATRVTMHEAKRHFEAGGAVLVSEYGHEPTQTVTPITTTHDRTRTTWDALAADVKEWRNRYPNQRFYIVPTVGQTRQAPRESTIVPVNDSGELECSCGSHQIQELGQIAPGGLWWYHVGQNAATRVLRVGGWEWEGADGIGFECRDCHAEYDVLPEGWDVDYV